jgi:hypothetical protein
VELGAVVPVVAIVFSLSIPLLAIWTDHKKDMALIEKGLYQPEKPGPRGQTSLVWGLILTLVGMAVIIGSLVMYRHLLMAGLVVEALGIALLVYTLIVKHKAPVE